MRIKNIITLSASFLISILVVILGFAVFNPIKLDIQHKETLNTVKEVFKDATDFIQNENEVVNGVTISKSLRVLGSGQKALGYLYEANTTNAFGNIKILVSAGVDERIIEVTIIELNQTMYQTQTTNLAAKYKNAKLNKDIPDLAAGATSISLNSFMDMMVSVGIHHDSNDKFPFAQPYVDYFGPDYTVLETVPSKVGETSIVKEVISNNAGFVYSLTKSGKYANYSSSKEPITLVVVLNNEGKILGMLLPVDLYFHSEGAYYEDNLKFVKTFEGMNISEILDGYTGTTAQAQDGEAHNSKTLSNELLFILQGVLK